MFDLHFEKNKYYKEDDTYYIILNIQKDLPFEISTITIKYTHFRDAKNHKPTHEINIINNQIPNDITETMLSYFVEIKSFVKILEDNLEQFLSRKPVTVNYFPICSKKTNLELVNFDNDPARSHFDYMTIAELNVIIQCDRCSAISTNHCKRCGPLYGVVFEPHTHTTELGHIEFNACRLADWESCSIFVSTVCNNIVYIRNIKNRSIARCKCGEQIVVERFEFEIVGADKQKQKKRRSQNIKINSSFATSKNGSCKHYKKSFKFYIFPCCNAKFECDICHDDNMDHKAQRADKMICGLCFKLQNVGICCEQKQNGHWNNGQGCRNKLTMNRKDSKKYKN